MEETADTLITTIKALIIDNNLAPLSAIFAKAHKNPVLAGAALLGVARAVGFLAESGPEQQSSSGYQAHVSRLQNIFFEVRKYPDISQAARRSCLIYCTPAIYTRLNLDTLPPR
jgi:hypothetical protein